MLNVAQDTLYTKLLFDGTQAVQELNKFAAAGRNIGMLQKSGADMSNTIKNLENNLGKNSRAFRVLNENMKESKNMFDMNTLSWLFGGMQLKMFGQSLLKFVIPSMDKLNQLNTEGAKQVGRLYAGFEFLKISMFETLSNTDLFRNFIEFLITATDQLSEFVQEHPVMVEMIATLGLIGIALGTLAIGKAFMMQMDQLSTLLGGDNTKGIWGASKGFGKTIAKWAISNPLLASALILATLIGTAALSVEDARDELIKLGESNILIPLQNLTNEFLGMLGFSVDLGDEWKALAAIGVWAFSPALININLFITAIMSLLELLDWGSLKLSKFGATVGYAFSLDPEKKDFFADRMKEIDKEIDEVSSNFKERFSENMEGISMSWDNLLKGPIGIFKEWDTEENKDILGIDEKTSGTDKFQNLWDQSILNLNDQMTTATDEITNMFETSTLNTNQYFNDNVIDPVSKWQPAEKTLTIRANYVGFNNDDSPQQSVDANVGSITGYQIGG